MNGCVDGLDGKEMHGGERKGMIIGLERERVHTGPKRKETRHEVVTFSFFQVHLARLSNSGLWWLLNK